MIMIRSAGVSVGQYEVSTTIDINIEGMLVLRMQV